MSRDIPHYTDYLDRIVSPHLTYPSPKDGIDTSIAGENMLYSVYIIPHENKYFIYLLGNYQKYSKLTRKYFLVHTVVCVCIYLGPTMTITYPGIIETIPTDIYFNKV